MHLAVSYNDRGEITTLFDPERLHIDKGTLRYVPAEGENHHVLEVPKHLEAAAFEELPELLRVDVSAGHPRLEPNA